MGKLVFAFQLIAIAIASAGVGQKETPLAHAQKPCFRAEERQALVEYEKLKTWADIFRSFEKYSHCDDGAIAEGYSDKIVHLLAKDWKSFPELNRLTKKDPAFRSFVIHHIDETADTDELRSAQQNARRQCPEESKTLCRAIERQIAQLPAR